VKARHRSPAELSRFPAWPNRALLVGWRLAVAGDGLGGVDVGPGILENARPDFGATAHIDSKTCPFCGGELLAKALKCRHCRQWMPEAQVSAPSRRDEPPVSSASDLALDARGQSLRHLILLSMATFGLYLFYWSWRSWTDIRDETGADVNPILRTAALLLPFVSIYVLYSLLREIKELGQSRGVVCNFSPGLLTAAFHLIVFATNVGLLWFLAFAIVIPLLPAQQALNEYWQAVRPNMRIREHLTSVEIIVAAVGTLLVVQLLITLSQLPAA